MRQKERGRERERERESGSARERERMCVCVCQREGVRERKNACVCEREREGGGAIERETVCVRERESDLLSPLKATRRAHEHALRDEGTASGRLRPVQGSERELIIDNLLVPVHQRKTTFIERSDFY